MNAWLASTVSLIALIAIAALVLAVISYWRIRHKSGKSSSSKKGTCKDCGDPSAYDIRTTDIISLSQATGGAGGATGAEDSGFVTVLSTTIDTCNKTNTLFCDVSAESLVGIIEVDDNATGTTVVSSTSAEGALITMRVLVDGFVAAPGEVTFDDITHTITTNILPSGFRAELLALTSANSFDFVAQNVPKGHHSVVVQARLQTSVLAINEVFDSATAVLGNRTLVVQPAYVVGASSGCSSSSSSSAPLCCFSASSTSSSSSSS